MDRSTSRTVPPSRPISKSREVPAGTHAGDRVSRQKVRFTTRTSVPHGGTPSHSDATSSRGNRAARSSISQSGVTSRAVRYGSHRPIRQATHETIPVGRDSSGMGRKRQRRMGTGHRPVSLCARMVDGPVTLVGRSTVPGAVPPRDSLHRCVDQRLGCSIPGIDVEWDVAETRSSHKLVGAAGGPDRTTVTPVPPQREDSSVQ